MTSKALIYRPNSRWRIAIAFTVAAAIHLSAVAIASLRHETAVVNSGTEFPAIEIEPDVDLATPSQTEAPMEAAPPSVPSEFVEIPPPPRPIPQRQRILPIRTVGQTGITPNPRAYALSAPRPEYPYEARSRHITGSGVVVMAVDPATGFVDDVFMEQSIGNSILDNAAISAFRRWRFKSGTPRKIRVPITFNLTGAQY
jgi:TonB family protein